MTSDSFDKNFLRQFSFLHDSNVLKRLLDFFIFNYEQLNRNYKIERHRIRTFLDI